MPGLAIPTTGRQASGFEDLLDEWFRHRLRLKLPDCQDRAHRIKDFHDAPRFLSFTRAWLLLRAAVVGPGAPVSAHHGIATASPLPCLLHEHSQAPDAGVFGITRRW